MTFSVFAQLTPRYHCSLPTTVLALLLLLASPMINAAELRIAVAANFTTTLERLVEAFSGQYPSFSASISSGASGKHFAQIRQGAPFDVFFSADNQLTAQLIASGHAQADSRAVYATGVLVLWSPDPEKIPGDGLPLLRSGEFRHLAMANPRTAPYGAAAQSLLQNVGVNIPPGKLVSGQSVGQAFTFVSSGNAELGLLAASQVIAYERENAAGSRWVPDANSYPAIVQELVILNTANQPKAAQAFIHWVLTHTDSHAIIRADGYGIAEK
ncbi:MAG TPA: molybdate ABC transporter substrate-binding protein [Cellvibrionaceae bacterium]